MCLSQDVGDSIGFWAGLPELQLLPRPTEPGPSQDGAGVGTGRSQSRQTGSGKGSCPALCRPRVVSGEVEGMAWSGEREASMSVLERLLANAALRDEAGRLRSPEPRARPPSGSGVSQGMLGGGAGSLVPLLSWAG